ncbi:MAG: hypothetical protein WCJ07_04010 [Verrucomicrobiota bacterium]
MNPLEYPDNLDLQSSHVFAGIPDAIHLRISATEGMMQLGEALNLGCGDSDS